MIYSRYSAILLLCLLVLPGSAAAQSGYTPRGLYDAESMRLENGFQVLMKQQPETRNVAFRLVVNVGTRYFDCAHRETPHLLEHLLFSGTTRHTEAELEHLITDHGGTWNAVTGTEHTTFQVDIFDRFSMEGLDALYEIMTDTVITPEKISKAKGIVYREEGGKPGTLRRFLYGLGIGKRAWKKANEWLLPGNGAVCPGLVNMDGITGEDVMQVFKTTYVPANMTLIAVGSYDRVRFLDRIIRTFGSLPRAPKPAMNVVTPPPPARGPAAVSSALSPFFGSSGSFSMAFRTEGRNHSDAAPLIVLSSHLNAKFYEQVRIKAGLSYAPEAVMFFQPDYGIFYATADIGMKNLERVRELMTGILEMLRREKISFEEAERTKKNILLQWAQGYETNAGLASLYEEKIARAEHRTKSGNDVLSDRLQDYEREIGAVATEDLDRVIERYLRPDRQIDIRSVPTMSYTVFFTFTGGLLLLIAMVVGYRLRRAGKQKKSMLPLYLRRY
jgi:predicted Zn-dependent peptidase